MPISELFRHLSRHVENLGATQIQLTSTEKSPATISFTKPSEEEERTQKKRQTKKPTRFLVNVSGGSEKPPITLNLLFSPPNGTLPQLQTVSGDCHTMTMFFFDPQTDTVKSSPMSGGILNLDRDIPDGLTHQYLRAIHASGFGCEDADIVFNSDGSVTVYNQNHPYSPLNDGTLS